MISHRLFLPAERERRASAWVFTLGLVFAVFVILTSGCCTDLQLDYVEANEKAHRAIMLDVEAGLYLPDAASTATLGVWAGSNAAAREAAEAE